MSQKMSRPEEVTLSDGSKVCLAIPRDRDSGVIHKNIPIAAVSQDFDYTAYWARIQDEHIRAVEHLRGHD